MLPSMTPAVSRALALASGYAHAAGRAEISPDDMLVALLIEEDGQAATLAIAHGFDWAAWRGRLSAPVDGEALPPSSTLASLLDDARVLALELTGDRTVSGDLALFCLVGLERLRDQLAEFGLNVAGFREAVQATKPPAPVVDHSLRLADVTERFDTARILDASANRAREALRVLEDHARFVLNDATLCEMAKSMRHDLTRALLELGPPGLLESRDTLGDVGTKIEGTGEYTRLSLTDVLAAAARRLGEALRSLEEFGKLVHPLLGERIEAVRYRSYTLEWALSLGGKAQARLKEARLYVLLTGANCAASLEWTIEQAAEGGASVFQLREKSLTGRELLARARDVRRWTRKAGALFIVNDRPDIARLAEADGVHLGQDDMGVRDARRILGPDALVGVSTHDETQVRQAVLDGASYIGVGPTFPSATKSFETFAGLEFVRRATELTGLPAFAIGGINAGNVAEVAAAGARRVAVSQAVAGADDPRLAARALLAALPEL
jgi:thiamine-phosphate pyrophosphorylase